MNVEQLERAIRRGDTISGSPADIVAAHDRIYRRYRRALEDAVRVLGWIGDDDQPPHPNVDMAWKAREIVDTLRAVLDGEDFYGEPVHPPEDDPPCSGSGYAHKPHGRCPGYSTDRT